MLTHEGSNASDKEMNSESAANEINECYNSDSSINNFDCTVVKMMNEKMDGCKERVLTDDNEENACWAIDGLPLLSSDVSTKNIPWNEIMDAETKSVDIESHSFEHIEQLKLMAYDF